MKTTALSVRMDEFETQQVDDCARQSGLDRSSLLKKFIRTGLKQYRMEQALRAYRLHEVSLSRAAEIAELSTRDFLARMESANLELNYYAAELDADLQDF
ncbi:MAG: UPF0175 family protein [Pontiellaceae bacterium]|nr:UPF0175 family protein [Pontiellaceae bacterium]